MGDASPSVRTDLSTPPCNLSLSESRQGQVVFIVHCEKNFANPNKSRTFAVDFNDEITERYTHLC